MYGILSCFNLMDIIPQLFLRDMHAQISIWPKCLVLVPLLA